MPTTDKKRFPDESRDHYTYPDIETLLDNLDHLAEMVTDHETLQCPRLDELDDYYEGGNVTILKKNRRKEEHLADNRAIHNFAEYVSQFIEGYMAGIPIKVAHDDDAVNDRLNEFNKESDGDAHNSDLILDLSIYGRAYELLYRSKSDENKLALLSPLETFVIYDNTVEQSPIAGVRYMTNKFKNVEFSVYLYTENEIIQFIKDDEGKYLVFSYWNSSLSGKHSLHVLNGASANIDQRIYIQLLEANHSGTVDCVIDLGKPTFRRRDVSFKIGWTNGWGSGDDRFRFRMLRVIQTDILEG